ncbi:hypothetical protein K3495_g9475 [Podosphaera aphanis]|nr:hypothetical protein K3495_g9475 [Podosphaera aphanis]
MPPEWPKDELGKIIAAGGFNSRRNPDLPGSYAYLKKIEQERNITQPLLPRESDSSDIKPPALKLNPEIPQPNKFKDEKTVATKIISDNKEE